MAAVITTVNVLVGPVPGTDDTDVKGHALPRPFPPGKTDDTTDPVAGARAGCGQR